MRRKRNIGTVVLVVVLGLPGLSACGGAEGAPISDEPIVIDEIDGSELKRLTLSERAAQRLDIQTVSVTANGDHLVVPSAAVIIDPQGTYWVYENPEPLVFVRNELRSVREEGGHAYFAEGLAEGALVVVTGVPELYGAEFGIGK